MSKKKTTAPKLLIIDEEYEVGNLDVMSDIWVHRKICIGSPYPNKDFFHVVKSRYVRGRLKRKVIQVAAEDVHKT